MSRVFFFSDPHRGKRVFLVLGFFAAALFAAACFGAASVWMEKTFPSDHAERALFPIAQCAVVNPVMEGDDRKAANGIRRQTEVAYLFPTLSLEEIIRRFSDARIDPAERRHFAYRLARAGSSSFSAISA